MAKNSYLNMLKRKKLLDKAYQTLQRVLCRSTCFAMLPHQHSTQSPQRLFYVAMTRARNRLACALSSPRWDSLAQPDSILSPDASITSRPCHSDQVLSFSLKRDSGEVQPCVCIIMNDRVYNSYSCTCMCVNAAKGYAVPAVKEYADQI